MNFSRTFFLLLFLLAGIYCKAAQSDQRNTNAAGVLTDSLPLKCAKTEEIEKIISEAISLGGPIYNEGLHLACYRIYEWAAYKIIYVYGPSCKNVEAILKAAVDKTHGDFSDTEKAWLMRAAFDKVLGVPTQIGNPEKEKETLQKNG